MSGWPRMGTEPWVVSPSLVIETRNRRSMDAGVSRSVVCSKT